MSISVLDKGHSTKYQLAEILRQHSFDDASINMYMSKNAYGTRMTLEMLKGVIAANRKVSCS